MARALSSIEGPVHLTIDIDGPMEPSPATGTPVPAATYRRCTRPSKPCSTHQTLLLSVQMSTKLVFRKIHIDSVHCGYVGNKCRCWHASARQRGAWNATAPTSGVDRLPDVLAIFQRRMEGMNAFKISRKTHLPRLYGVLPYVLVRWKRYAWVDAKAVAESDAKGSPCPCRTLRWLHFTSSSLPLCCSMKATLVPLLFGPRLNCHWCLYLWRNRPYVHRRVEASLYELSPATVLMQQSVDRFLLPECEHEHQGTIESYYHFNAGELSKMSASLLNHIESGGKVFITLLVLWVPLELDNCLHHDRQGHVAAIMHWSESWEDALCMMASRITNIENWRTLSLEDEKNF